LKDTAQERSFQVPAGDAAAEKIHADCAEDTTEDKIIADGLLKDTAKGKDMHVNLPADTERRGKKIHADGLWEKMRRGQDHEAPAEDYRQNGKIVSSACGDAGTEDKLMQVALLEIQSRKKDHADAC